MSRIGGSARIPKEGSVIIATAQVATRMSAGTDSAGHGGSQDEDGLGREYRIAVQADEDGTIIAWCLDIDGVATSGATKEEAIMNVTRAIEDCPLREPGRFQIMMVTGIGPD